MSVILITTTVADWQKSDSIADRSLRSNGNSEEQQVTSLELSSTKTRLQVDCARPSDAGLYTCVAVTGLPVLLFTWYLSSHRHHHHHQQQHHSVTATVHLCCSNRPTCIAFLSGFFHLVIIIIIIGRSSSSSMIL